MAAIPIAQSAPIPVAREAARPGADRIASLPAAGRYATSVLLVVVATSVALSLESQVGDRNLTLIYVLPVIAAAYALGWGPSLLATAAGVLAFDFFFTEPKYSFTIASPADLWAAGLLLVIASVVSAVGAESRRRERVASEAAQRARALQALAHLVIRSGTLTEVTAEAAVALHKIFDAPAVVFMRGMGECRGVASAGLPKLTPSEIAAANWVRSAGIATRAETYPFGASLFDFWPVGGPGPCECVIGVGFAASGRGRPAEADRFAEMVSGYLAAALGRPGGTGAAIGVRS
jgi:two-component system sensor histidine kinase KdpD